MYKPANNSLFFLFDSSYEDVQLISIIEVFNSLCIFWIANGTVPHSMAGYATLR